MEQVILMMPVLVLMEEFGQEEMESKLMVKSTYNATYMNAIQNIMPSGGEPQIVSWKELRAGEN